MTIDHRKEAVASLIENSKALLAAIQTYKDNDSLVDLSSYVDEFVLKHPETASFIMTRLLVMNIKQFSMERELIINIPEGEAILARLQES